MESKVWEKLEKRLREEADAHLRKVARDGQARIAASSLFGACTDSAVAALASQDTPEPLRLNAVAALQSALRRERARARARHSSYDFNRHLALHQMLKQIDKARNRGAEGEKARPERGIPAN